MYWLCGKKSLFHAIWCDKAQLKIFNRPAQKTRKLMLLSKAEQHEFFLVKGLRPLDPIQKTPHNPPP
jgi:hypothetical protein